MEIKIIQSVKGKFFLPDGEVIEAKKLFKDNYCLINWYGGALEEEIRFYKFYGMDHHVIKNSRLKFDDGTITMLTTSRDVSKISFILYEETKNEYVFKYLRAKTPSSFDVESILSINKQTHEATDENGYKILRTGKTKNKRRYFTELSSCIYGCINKAEMLRSLNRTECWQVYTILSRRKNPKTKMVFENNEPGVKYTSNGFVYHVDNSKEYYADYDVVTYDQKSGFCFYKKVEEEYVKIPATPSRFSELGSKLLSDTSFCNKYYPGYERSFLGRISSEIFVKAIHWAYAQQLVQHKLWGLQKEIRGLAVKNICKNRSLGELLGLNFKRIKLLDSIVQHGVVYNDLLRSTIQNFATKDEQSFIVNACFAVGVCHMTLEEHYPKHLNIFFQTENDNPSSIIHNCRLYEDTLRMISNLIGRTAEEIMESDGVVSFWGASRKRYVEEALKRYPDFYTQLENSRSMQQVADLHDQLVTLISKQQTEKELKHYKILEEKYKNAPAVEKRKGWEYEDEKFMIKIPTPFEIKAEGRMLHHCVGGYVDEHLRGDTTIMLLRRKESPDKSFYTIEIRNDKIVQIHGFANKWLGNDPEVIPFVANWLRANNIVCDRNILLDTAHQYHASGVLCDVDINWSEYPNIM